MSGSVSLSVVTYLADTLLWLFWKFLCWYLLKSDLTLTYICLVIRSNLCLAPHTSPCSASEIISVHITKLSFISMLSCLRLDDRQCYASSVYYKPEKTFMAFSWGWECLVFETEVDGFGWADNLNFKNTFAWRNNIIAVDLDFCFHFGNMYQAIIDNKEHQGLTGLVVLSFIHCAFYSQGLAFDSSGRDCAPKPGAVVLPYLLKWLNK